MSEYITLRASAIDLTGQRFGRLTVLGPVDRKNQQVVWLCQCDCGNQSKSRGDSLRGNDTLSCGCLMIERTVEANTKHGMWQEHLYGSWHSMIQRCTNPNVKSYARYGGRGIKVCREWRDSFETYYADVSQIEGFGAEGVTLDRIDNNGDYTPGNVRWASATVQERNRQNNVMITFGGRTQCQSAWEEELGLSENTLRQRLKQGWSVERALTTRAVNA